MYKYNQDIECDQHNIDRLDALVGSVEMLKKNWELLKDHNMEHLEVDINTNGCTEICIYDSGLPDGFKIFRRNTCEDDESATYRSTHFFGKEED